MTQKIDLTIAKKQALALHQQGHLIQAEQGYKSILVYHPQELTVLHLLGILYQQQVNLNWH
jgi:hypothetical protein